MRSKRPSLLGTVARTAVITKTAQVVAGSGKKAAPAAPAPAEPVAPPAAAGLTDDKIAQLQKLADLHKSGVLTDEEFSAQKAKLLA